MSESLRHELINAFKESGCPVCRLENAAVDNYLQTALRETSRDLSMRHELKESLGFCREHTWRLKTLGLGRTLATALGYHDALLTVVQSLQNADYKTPSPIRRLLRRKRNQKPARFDAIVKALTPVKSCPACRLGDGFRLAVIRELVGSLTDRQASETMADSDGLCLPHLRQAFALVEDLDSCKMLILIHVPHYEMLRKNLVEIIREIDQREGNRSDPKEEELWRRVISVVNGDR